MMMKKSRSITNIGVAHFVTITYNNEDLNYCCDLFSLYAQLNFSCFFIEISTISGSPKKKIRWASANYTAFHSASVSLTNIEVLKTS